MNHAEPGVAPMAGEERVSTMVGDRLCIGCGYNLTGQAVLREPHYRMLIVRCPECGTVACLQEYPALGRWAGRWEALIAAGWLVALLVLALASGGILAGLAESVAQSASTPWALALAERQQEHFKALEAQGTLPVNVRHYLQMGPHAYAPLDSGWLSGQDLALFLREAGGWWAVVRLAALRSWGWTAAAAFPMGCVWAVALLHLRGRALLLAGFVPLALAAGFLALVWTTWTSPWGSWVVALEVAKRQVGLPVLVASLVFSALPLAAGLLSGRPIARGLVRALLPPRLRGPLAVLWTTQGLDPPVVRGSR